MIYLDNSATTQPLPEVVTLIHNELSDLVAFGNPGSLHRLGALALKNMNDALKSVATTLKTDATEIIFTSGGTESINTAIRGFLDANKQRGRHIITTNTEHRATLSVLEEYEKNGYVITYVPIDQDGQIDINALEASWRSDTILASFTHINNETGAIFPVEAVSLLRKRMNPRTAIHLDCVQSAGKINVYPKDIGIDMASFSGHKMHGVKGVGALYIRKGLKVQPLITGGGQQKRLRSGTEPVYLFRAFALALQRAYIDAPKTISEVRTCSNMIKNKIIQLGGMIHSGSHAVPHIISTSLPPFEAETLLHALEAEDIYISTISACASRSRKTSHVLLAMGIPEHIARSAVRISLSRFNTVDEIKTVCDALEKIMGKYALH